MGPGSADLDPSRMRPFEAEYEQMGFPFITRLVRTTEPRPVWSFQMIMEGPNGVGIDHVGHYADDLSLAFRRFAFGAFGPEYIDASAGNDELRVRRMVMPPDGPPSATETVTPLSRGVFDGTFVYWLIGTLPLRSGYTWTFRTWQPTADSVTIRETPAFVVMGREPVTLGDGTVLDAWRVEVQSSRATVRMWVTTAPPYLIRQDMTVAGGNAQTVIDLKRIR